MGDPSGLLASQGREHVSNANSLDILDGIALRGKDPRVMRHLGSDRQWGIHRHSLFLFTPSWAERTSISPRVWRRHRLFHRQAKEAKAWVEVGNRAHRSGLRGPRGVPTPWYRRLGLQISMMYRVRFYSYTS